MVLLTHADVVSVMLYRGDLAAAMQHLQDARSSCPRSKSAALVKIQRFIDLIEAQEKRTSA